ncbi:class A beta-lactamase [Gluconobacter wancherniae]|uniref:Beta-lactamase n=1 Tax=Gluconobacter wancherniae NBRC 103581 TaxID=656744 RepID=A0A511B0D5_9PROT|nr:class A beta-lactamase [Gluconobacter wancherniae]MBF0854251.1 class A beta-lactamase [Gluconobacter wancherniae]GEK93916.1 beta-lactamase [Gluconobacter wancherniae NBRC 103581]
MPRPYMTRRLLTAGILLSSLPTTLRAAEDDVHRKLAWIERKSGGRLGVCAYLSGTTRPAVTYRGGERFPMCSTCKALLSAAVLARVDRGRESLSRKILIRPQDLMHYSPITQPHIGTADLTLGDMCSAAVSYSDNTAANALLRVLGGPAMVTAFARSIGDTVTRLDRWEPALNEALPGDPRDTTTPEAMSRNLTQLLSGDALSSASRRTLLEWMVANQTGDARIRAGVPKSWRVGDKTGTGSRGTINDIAFIMPPEKTPFALSIYLTGSPLSANAGNAIIAEIARTIAEMMVA